MAQFSLEYQSILQLCWLDFHIYFTGCLIRLVCTDIYYCWRGILFGCKLIFGCVVGKVLLFIGTTSEPAALLQCRLPGCGFLGGNCGLLLPGPAQGSHRQWCHCRTSLRGSCWRLRCDGCHFSAEQTAAAAACSTLFGVRVVILMMD